MKSATVHPIRPDLILTLETLRKLNQAFRRVDFIDFAATLRDAGIVDKGYVMRGWKEFSSDPIGYTVSRSTKELGDALLLTAMNKMNQE